MSGVKQDLQAKLAETLHGKWYGHYFAARCPKHEDKKPSLLVYPDIAVCKSCGSIWSLEGLQRKISRSKSTSLISVEEFRSRTFSWQGVDVWALADLAHDTLMRFSPAMQYLKDRCVDGRVELNRLGWYANYYTIPITNDLGDIIRLALRAGPEIESQVDDRYNVSPGDWDLFVPDWHLLKKSDYGYLTFGLFDAMTISDLRFPVASTLHGKTADIDRLKSMNKLWCIVADFGEESDAHELVAKLGWHGRVVPLHYPEGCKDPNDMVRKGHKKNLLKVLARGA